MCDLCQRFDPAEVYGLRPSDLEPNAPLNERTDPRRRERTRLRTIQAIIQEYGTALAKKPCRVAEIVLETLCEEQAELTRILS